MFTHLFVYIVIDIFDKDYYICKLQIFFSIGKSKLTKLYVNFNVNRTISYIIGLSLLNWQKNDCRPNELFNYSRRSWTSATLLMFLLSILISYRCHYISLCWGKYSCYIFLRSNNCIAHYAENMTVTYHFFTLQ